MRPASLRLRLLAYGVLLLIPIGSGTWALAEFAAARERARADSRLDATLRDVVAEYADAEQNARDRALTLARSRSVQRALARRDVRSLQRLGRVYPEASFLLFTDRRGQPPAGHAVRVVVGGRTVGEVVFHVRLDASLLAGLRRSAVVPPSDVLTLVSGRRALSDPPGLRRPLGLQPSRPADVELAGVRHRGLAATVERGRPDLELAVLRPKEPISAAAAQLRREVLYAGLATFLAVALVAYAAAPAVARGRTARERRVLAARILSQVRDGVVLVDRGGEIRSWNHGAERITAIPESAVLGRHATEAVPGWRELTSHVPVSGSEVTAPFRLDDGELQLSISAVGSEDGTLYAFRDLTAQHRLEAMRSEFVATVSHELRTPLASIYGAALTLRDRVHSETDLQRQLVSIITGESERLGQIVEEILLASELTSGELALRREEVDAEQLAHGAVEAARARLPANLSLELAAPSGLPPVSADERKARQVLTNLIDNAVKYSPDGGRIELRLEQCNGYVAIAVQDEGLGIPASEQEHIFEKFYRLDPSMLRGIGGTGLGLYICKELAERMGGRLRVSSRPGAGSTFFFELPVFT